MPGFTQAGNLEVVAAWLQSGRDDYDHSPLRPLWMISDHRGPAASSGALCGDGGHREGQGHGPSRRRPRARSDHHSVSTVPSIDLLGWLAGRGAEQPLRRRARSETRPRPSPGLCVLAARLVVSGRVTSGHRWPGRSRSAGSARTGHRSGRCESRVWVRSAPEVATFRSRRYAPSEGSECTPPVRVPSIYVHNQRHHAGARPGTLDAHPVC